MTAIALIDYGAGNLRSVHNALVAAGADDVAVTADPDIVAAAERIVLPGVGAFAACMNGLSAIDGLIDAMDRRVRTDGAPFLGICVGMQLMSDRGLEKTVTQGLGWIAGDVRQIEPADPSLKIPQIGWNTIHVKQPHWLFNDIWTGERGLHAYFVHSYQLVAANADDVVAFTEYGGEVTAAVARDNMAGTQFHPEKSQALGLALIANFLRWKP
jgi:imidazole glycerol-phosphate synthase subunit HisH